MQRTCAPDNPGLLNGEQSADKQNRKVFVSFGGLLLYVEGPYKKLTPLRVDNIYLLIKK